MILFIISLILICISSYFTASVFYDKTPENTKRQVLGFFNFLLVSFSQIVLSFEILSIFKIINSANFIILNLIFFTISIVFWLKNGKPLYVPCLKNELNKIKRAIKLDKSLLILSVCFLFFVFVTSVLCVFLPVPSYDALVYHLARVPFWLSNASLAHFDYPDLRINVMPINSELLYAWILLFFRTEWFLGCFSFLGYVVSIFCLYNFLGEFKFSTRKKLWSVFIFSSVASIVAEASGTETEIIIGALVFVSLYMWYLASKNESKVLLFFSSLSYALAIGTKTPAILAFIPCLICMYYLAKLSKSENIKKLYLYFILFLIVNFILFASYNYVSNFVTYSNPLGSVTAIKLHAFYGGFKAFFANIIRYMFLMLDFSGFNYADSLGPHIISLQNKIFELLKIPKDWGVLIPAGETVNKTLIDPLIGPGLLGFLVFLPCVFYASFSLFFFKDKKDIYKNKKRLFMGLCALLFLVNIIILSFSLGFMVYSIRFITFFIILSSPVFALSYIKKNRNIFKWLIVFYSFSYLVVISSHLSSRPFFKLAKIYTQEKTLPAFRERISCSDTFGYTNDMAVCMLNRELEKRKKPKKIAVFTDPNFRAYHLKMKEKDGWKVDFLLLEDFDKYNLEDYNYIVTNYFIQDSELIKYPERSQDYQIMDSAIRFFKNRPANCFYIDQYNVLIERGSNKTPIVTVCYIPTSTFNLKGFKQIKRMEINSRDQTQERYKDIIIYERI